jgi:hypothetical protein
MNKDFFSFRLLSGLFLFLVAVSVVSGAELLVQSNVEYDATASFSDENALDIVLIPSGFDPVRLSYDQNVSLYSLGQYDELSYSFPSSSTVIAPSGAQRLLSNGQTLTLSEAGVYSANRISDNASWQVQVEPFVYPTVDWRVQLPSGFTPRLQSGSFALSDEREINIEYRLENFTTADSYALTVVLDGLDFNVTRTVTVPEVTSYRSSLTVTDATVVAGESGEYAVLRLSGSGNKPDEAVATIVGNASPYLSVKRDVAIYPDLTLNYAVVYNVPTNAVKGSYDAELVVNLDGFIERYDLNLTIVDNTPPNVTLRLPPSLVVGVRYNASMNVVDSEDFSPFVTVNGANTSLVELGADFYGFEFLARDGLSIWACAVDDSDNEGCDNQTVSARVDDWFTENPAERVDTGRTRGETVHYLGQREYPGTYRFSYELVENTTAISLWLGDGNAQVRWDEGEVLNQSNRGASNLHVRMDEDGEYTLIVTVFQPLDGEGNDEMRLTGRFRQYTVPDAFELNLPGLVGPASCNPVEGSGFEDSFLSCELRYRLDYDISEISVPVTPAQLEEIEMQANATITQFEEREGVFFLIILLLAGGVMVSLAVLWLAGESRYIRRRG